ncbi:hypothetical protein [Mucilaginibacter ginsenosidivorans]|uniref:hypothetical protein n=1 Tax=Mucilaginibacter ginsenosidivorans TaxID=398053 RepID=UPI0016524C7F|nr:hypothetical protein [Mucilaginibacter ginsenosidivorans]
MNELNEIMMTCPGSREPTRSEVTFLDSLIAPVATEPVSAKRSTGDGPVNRNMV